MTPITATFSVDVNENLDVKTMHLIMSKGHSRVPVYSGSPANIIGLILVKNLLMAHPDDNLPLRQHATIRKIPRVDENMPLYDILNEFRKGHSHMAAVTKCSKDKLNHKISKELKSHIDIRLSSSRHWRKSSELRSMQGALAPMAVVLDIPDDYLTDSGNYVLTKRRSLSGSCISSAQKDNEMILECVSRPKKWERTSEADLLDLEQLSCQSFPSDEEVIGIITMEDVIEELLQEEILDETDEYIDVHNKIRVNMLRPGEKSPISTRSSPFLSASSSPSNSSLYTMASSLGLSHPTTEDAGLVSQFQAPKTTPVANSSPKVSISSPLSQIVHSSPKLDKESNGNHVSVRSSFLRPSCFASVK